MFISLPQQKKESVAFILIRWVPWLLLVGVPAKVYISAELETDKKVAIPVSIVYDSVWTASASLKMSVIFILIEYACSASPSGNTGVLITVGLLFVILIQKLVEVIIPFPSSALSFM